MPGFGAPFSGLANDRKLTPKELVRAIHFMIAAEYEATQLYLQLAESTDNKLAVNVLKAIADEELVHVGEFLRLLGELAPDEVKLYWSIAPREFTSHLDIRRIGIGILCKAWAPYIHSKPDRPSLRENAPDLQ